MAYGQIPTGNWNNPILTSGGAEYNTGETLQTSLNESHPGYLSDPFYSRIDIDDISTYLPVFLDDVERTAGVSSATLAKVQEIRNYRGRHQIHVAPDNAQWSDYLGSGWVGNVWSSSSVRAVTVSTCNQLGNQVVVFYRERDWNRGRHDNNVNSRIFVMWHEFGHAILDLKHTANRSNIMSGIFNSSNWCDHTEIDFIRSELFPSWGLFYPIGDCDSSFGSRDLVPFDSFEHEKNRTFVEADLLEYRYSCGTSKSTTIRIIED